MLDIGWSEMLVIAIVLIVVVGPKDLPRMLRTFGVFTSKLRGMADDFRKQFDDAMKDADLGDVKDAVDQVRKLNPAADIKKALNPMERAAADIRAGLETALKPSPPTPAATTPQPAEPLKTGPTAMPGETTATPVAPKPVEQAAPKAKAAPKSATAKTAAPKAAATKAKPASKKTKASS